MAFTRFRNGLFYFTGGCVSIVLCFLLVNTSGPRAIHIENYTGQNSTNNREACGEWKLASKTGAKKLEEEQESPDRFSDDGNNDFNVRSFLPCENVSNYTYLSRRGKFYVIYNFVKAEKDFGCVESITLSSPGDFRFLDNVIPLVERWKGPISIALYTPGHDFYTTIQSIAYLRVCETELIRELVSFHVFFDTEHMPKVQNETRLLDTYKDDFNCSIPPPWETVESEDMYKTSQNLLYPINVARNIAKLAAKTYFIFPSDIELYPTRNLIPLFFKFVEDNLGLFEKDTRNVFVLPIFEILSGQNVPENKTQLQTMLKNKTAILFHQTVCAVCHRVIDGDKWVKTPETEGLGVFSVGKREGRYVVWEPFYICTQKEPLWDERMTWEGQGNKMVQAFTMCVMNYDFHVLDNAFLIHKPGVKKEKVQIRKFGDLVRKSNTLLKSISIELQDIYGYNKKCRTIYYFR